MNIKRTRRGLLRGGAILGAAAAVPHIFGSAVFAKAPGHERHGDFLILPTSDTALPGDVVLTGTLPVLEGPSSNVDGRRFASPVDGRRELGFDLYLVEPPTPGIRQSGALEVVRNRARQVVLASVGYETFDSGSQAWVRTIESIVTEVYLRPFPVWPTNVDGISYPPQKVEGLPGPAILSKSALGFVVHWIQQERLYQLRIENRCSEQEALVLAASLHAA
jgi:hypothetical protein